MSSIIDIRSQLPLNPRWGGATIGYRPETRYITWHYNGPALPEYMAYGEGLMRWARSALDWQTRSGWSGTANGADGFCYNYIVGTDAVYLARDTDAQLWHAGNYEANTYSAAIVFPIGGGQAVPDAMLLNAAYITDVLLAWYNLPRNAVFGHRDWSANTLCPGDVIGTHLAAYKAGEAKPCNGWFRNRYPCTVRTEPSRRGRVVRSYPVGAHLEMAACVDGEVIDNNGQWYWLRSGEGFIHASAGFVRL
ncbi:MAG: N-acetylmuramoyl-L-alanine amidase [Chloroflexaceae bacterium]|nr:N-acetylmuramoyl-L-alanine amidase [Chloroflexaceae bacterium]